VDRGADKSTCKADEAILRLRRDERHAQFNLLNPGWTVLETARATIYLTYIGNEGLETEQTIWKQTIGW